MFQGNEAHSCLNGFWFDFYGVGALSRDCTSVTDFTAWKIWEYAVYGEIPTRAKVEVVGLRSADARVGSYIIMIGVDAKIHSRKDQRVVVKDALIVGHSNNAHCQRGYPALHTCKFFMAWCGHLGLTVRSRSLYRMHWIESSCPCLQYSD